MSQNQTIALVVVVAVVAGGVGFWFGTMNARPEAPASASDITDEAAGNQPTAGADLTLSGGANTIAVDDQDAGSTATIRMATLSEEGWVVIHEDWGGGPGNILGARRLSAGEHQAVVIELLRSTEGGKVYYAMLHRDDGDKAFAHTRDLPIMDAEGSPIMMRFVATTKPGTP